MKFTSLFTRRPLALILDKVIEVNYLLIIFLVPVWFASLFPTFNIFELNKILVFKTLVCFLFFLTSFKIIFFSSNTTFTKANKWVTIEIFKKYFLIPAILIGYLLVSLFFSLDYQQSFFGSYDRQQGVVSYLFYFLWAGLVFINLISAKKSELNNNLFKAKIKRVLMVISASAFLVAVYGILQILNIDFTNWPEAPYLTGRTLSSMGQPNFLASFLLLTIPVSAYLVYVGHNFLLRSFYFLTTILQIICLFTTASRGALLALILTIIIFIGYLFFTSSLKGRAKWLVLIVSILITLSGFFVMEAVTPGRLRESVNFSNGSFAARVNFFQAGADAVTAKPFFGYGPENSGEVFIKYYERDWGTYSDVSSNTDRAHNLMLDIILNAGIFGLIIFSLWYYSFFKLAFLESRNSINKSLALALSFGALSYLISLLFSFSVVVTEVYFWLLFAVLAALAFKPDQAESDQAEPDQAAVLLNDTKKIHSNNRLQILLIIIIFLLSSWQIVRNMESLKADAYFNDAYVAVGKGELREIVGIYNHLQKMKINPVQMEFYRHFIGDNLSNQFDKISDESLREVVRNELIEIATSLPEQGYKNILLKAKIASQLENYEAADKYFDLVFDLAPDWPLARMERARDFIRRGDVKKAEAAYQLVDLSLPDLNSGKINYDHSRIANYYKYLAYASLGEAYFVKGDYNRAKIFYQAAYKSNPADYTLLKRIADSYYLLGDLESALKYVIHGALLNNTDYNWQVALASLYFEQGNRTQALLKMDAAIKLAPDNESLQEIKEKYKN